MSHKPYPEDVKARNYILRELRLDHIFAGMMRQALGKEPGTTGAINPRDNKEINVGQYNEVWEQCWGRLLPIIDLVDDYGFIKMDGTEKKDRWHIRPKKQRDAQDNPKYTFNGDEELGDLLSENDIDIGADFRWAWEQRGPYLEAVNAKNKKRAEGILKTAPSKGAIAVMSFADENSSKFMEVCIRLFGGQAEKKEQDERIWRDDERARLKVIDQMEKKVWVIK